MSGKLSRRSAGVDPFIVMDVMAAAAEKEAAGELRLSGLHFGIAAGILTKLTSAKRFERLD